MKNLFYWNTSSDPYIKYKWRLFSPKHIGTNAFMSLVIIIPPSISFFFFISKLKAIYQNLISGSVQNISYENLLFKRLSFILNLKSH